MVGMGGMANQMEQHDGAAGDAASGGMGGGRMGMAGGMGQRRAAKKKGEGRARARTAGTNARQGQKAIDEAKGPTLFDLYFDIVQVKVYGQARFFNAPPADAGGRAEPVRAEAARGRGEARRRQD